MKTEYKHGLGKDRRELSYYQTKDWMNKISKNRKYDNQKGEKHPKAFLSELDIEVIRTADSRDRLIWCRVHKISERHWYHIRARKRWGHL